jgi:hypothetical protein
MSACQVDPRGLTLPQWKQRASPPAVASSGAFTGTLPRMAFEKNKCSGGAAGVLIGSVVNRELEALQGKRVSQIAAEQRQDPLDALFDLIHAEALRGRCQVLEVDDVMLDFGTNEAVVEEAPRQNDYPGIPLMCLKQAKTFSADQAGCAEE